MNKRPLAALLATTALAACGGVPSVNIADKWSKAIEQYDLIPLYPPQEDVIPGDVFLLGVDDGNTTGWKVRIGQLPKDKLTKVLASNYNDRLTFTTKTVDPLPAAKPGAANPGAAKPGAAAPSPSPQAAKGAAQGQPGKAAAAAPPAPAAPEQPAAATEDPPWTETYVGVDDKGGSIRLRAIALPALSLGRYTQADLAGGGGIAQNIGLALGFAADTDTKLTVGLDQVRELHVGSGSMMKAMDANQLPFLSGNFLPSYIVRMLAQRNPRLAQAVCDGRFNAPDDAYVSVLVVNEVTYAGTIKYGYTDSSTFAGRIIAQATTPTTTAGGAVPANPSGTTTSSSTTSTTTPPGTTAPSTTTTSTTTTSGPTGGGGPSAGAAPSTKDRVDGLASTVKGLTDQYKSANPGAQVSFGIGTDGSLALSKTFPYPLAFGFAGSARFSIGHILGLYRERLPELNANATSATDLQALREVSDDLKSVTWVCRQYGSQSGALYQYLIGSDQVPVILSTGVKPLPAGTHFR